MKAEVAAAEGRGKAEAEKTALQAALNSAVAQAEAQQANLHLTIQRLETDAKDYKVSSQPVCYKTHILCTIASDTATHGNMQARMLCLVEIACKLDSMRHAWSWPNTSYCTPLHPKL